MPANIWSQLASFFFLMSAVFTDLLLLRFCLVLANMFLVVSASVGFPLWPAIYGDGGPAVDSLVWASLALVLHLWALIRLLLDERPMKPFEAPDDEALYRFFALRTGIRRVDFLDILEHGEWVHVPESGRLLPTESMLYLVVEGAVACKVTNWRRRPTDDFRDEASRFVLGSGDFFDLKLGNTFGIPIGFHSVGFEARTASSQALLFAWPAESLNYFATKAPGVVGAAWRNMVSFAVADVAHSYMNPSQHPKYLPAKDDSQYPQQEEVAELAHRHPDFSTLPDTVSMRRKKMGCWDRTEGFLGWVFGSMDPRPPKGVRHYAVPPQFVVNADMTITKAV
ncbi:hypothetical protein DFJ74DRAFT_57345 [Hyaloraphidium curvatum]|nr:hypothetical protein DFJ74DRAFT_57345 [Hyaloraphidium curvatum]